jgi:AcrR family transcriptional regulator
VLASQFPNLCRAIARKELQNREIRRAGIRAGLIRALSEEPPPATAALARRLGCSQGYLESYFPELYQRLLEARKAWRAKEWGAIQRRIETVAAEMPGASVPEVCRATGVRQMFIYTHFPGLYKQIVSGFIARRDALREQRRAALRDDVRKAVAELVQRGSHPSVNNVIPFLRAEAGRDWKRIRQEIDRAMGSALVGEGEA